MKSTIKIAAFVFGMSIIACLFSCDDNGNLTSCEPIIFDPPFDLPFIGDPYEIDEIGLVENCVMVNLSYSGGCAEHDFELRASQSPLTVYPPIINLVLSHDANGDMCEAYISDDIRLFDLNSIAEDINMEDVVLQFINYDESLSYQSGSN